MNYEEMSDLQINLLVANTIGVDAVPNSGVVFGVVKHRGDNVVSVIGVVDYCNNPSDARPIILANKIAVCPYNLDEESEEYEEMKDVWFAMKSLDGTQFDHKNPLRAAMIVFLMMQEQAK